MLMILTIIIIVNVFFLHVYILMYTRARGEGDLASPSFRAAPFIPLVPASMFSVLAPRFEPNQMGESRRFRDFCLHSGKVSLHITSLFQ